MLHIHPFLLYSGTFSLTMIEFLKTYLEIKGIAQKLEKPLSGKIVFWTSFPQVNNLFTWCIYKWSDKLPSDNKCFCKGPEM